MNFRFYIFLLLTFLPTMHILNPWIEESILRNVLLAGKCVSVLVLFCVWLLNKHKCTTSIWYLTVFCGCVCISGLINQALPQSFIGMFIGWFIIYFFLGFGLHRCHRETLSVVSDAICVVLSINVLFYVFGEVLGLLPILYNVETNCFIGHRNGVYLWSLTAMTSALLLRCLYGESKRFILAYLLAFINVVIHPSLSSMLGVLVFSGLYFTGMWKTRVLTFWKLTIVYLIMFFSIVVYRVQDNYEDFFESIGKDVTLTNRTYIWDATMPEISSFFWFGHGVEDGEDRKLLTYNATGVLDGINAHNLIIELLYSFGSCGLLCYALWYYSSFRKLDDDERDKAVLLCLASLLIVSLTEATVVNYYAFFLFCMADFAKDLKKDVS